MAEDVAERRLTTWEFVKTLKERRVFVMLLLGMAAGLPFFLIFDTLSAWLRQEGLSLQTITAFSLATLSYSLKFVWAPMVDRVKIPVLEPLLGQRRSWMVLMQIIIIVGLWLIAGSDPSMNLTRVALLAVLVGFAGATQDIAIDAWRIEVVDKARFGVMAAAYQWGYRGAMITAGALPLFLAEAFSWNLSYAVMAGIMFVAIAAVLLAPRGGEVRVALVDHGLPRRPGPEVVEWAARLTLILLGALFAGSGLAANGTLLAGLVNLLGGTDAGAEAFKTAWEARPNGIFLQFGGVVAGLALIALACVPIPGVVTRPGAYLRRSYGQPLGDFFQRFGVKFGVLIMALICLYRLSDFVLNLMNPFYIDLGFSLSEIAEVRKVYGVVASLAGITFGAWMVSRFGIIKSMVIGVFASPLSNLVFVWLAVSGPNMAVLYGAITIDNFATGVAGTALIVYMSSLTSAGFTATQYALFSSLYAIFGKITASQSGRIVEETARAAEAGGFNSAIRGWFGRLPEGSLAEGAATAGVSAPSLGAGYVTFFLYSVLLGVFAIFLAFYVAKRQPEIEARGKGEA
ncbi:MAG: PAT family beta-lactamase induction signal transducer AmpG [Brevundimonas sp.]|jgi:PAT family beta-lactamase induction signal transducer AmpG|uniref:AmpG family muropeptide MFS transporter n=1 Tax=Brevundimonas sp. TaxID=1871086 RepID=UPI0039E6846E